jgi:phosphopantothenoylcysteine decarboxylase/phosphopantothenate--cysteine ligase
MLYQKNILLGISGGIAAYKCAELVRLFVKQGASVKVVMTKSATEFVTPQTLSVLSKNEVLIDFFDNNNNWNNHVALAEWADVLIVAPCTANTLAKMSNGICDNLLLAVYLSAKSKTIVAPAMDLDMYQHPSVKQNISQLINYGNLVMPAETGELASGLVGEGRMPEPEQILKFTIDFFNKNCRLSGKTVLVNAGPTYEAIDPVRFIGNRSSGKMGIAISEALAKEGAKVILVLGPTNLSPKNHSVQVLRVESAKEMFEMCTKHFESCDIAICSAAVADYKPETIATSKIKKKENDLQLNLVRTVDILSELGKKKSKQFLVGFALETENVNEYAIKKLTEKKLDLIIANSAVESGSGFGVDTNKISIIDKHNKITNFELKSKADVAIDIVNFIIKSIQ